LSKYVKKGSKTWTLGANVCL